MRKVNFVCPECGSKILLVQEAALELSEVIGVDAWEGIEYFEMGDTHDYVVEEILGYECTCGYIVGNNPLEALDWLKENGMIENEDGRE